MADYAQLSETKTYLNVTDSSTDDLICTLISSATNKINEFVGYTFEIEYGSDESLFNVNDLDIIVLRKYPIVGISSIESGVDYQRVDDIGKIILENSFNGDFSLSVSFGQNPPDIVKTTCMELVNLFWTRRKMTGLKSMSMGDFSFTTNNSFNDEIKNILNMLHDYRDLAFSRTIETYNQQR